MVLAAVLALTLYLPLMAGQLSVASPGFYALGGYVAAILSTKVFHPGPGLYPVSTRARRDGGGGGGLGHPRPRRRRARPPIARHLPGPGHHRLRADPGCRRPESGGHRRRDRDLRHSAAVLEPAPVHVARHPAAPALDALRRSAGADPDGTGAGRAAGGRAGRGRHGREPDVPQGPRVHGERRAGRARSARSARTSSTRGTPGRAPSTPA